MKKTTRLRQLLKSGKALYVPGCYNALSAKILDKVGFPAIYMTGYGTSLSLLGMPDDYTQAALLPVAWLSGAGLKPARRLPVAEVAYWNRWGAR